MLAHTEPGILAVAGMSAALALLRAQGTTRMFLVRQRGLPLHVQALFCLLPNPSAITADGIAQPELAEQRFTNGA